MKTMMFAAALAVWSLQAEAAPELPKEVLPLQRLVGEWTTQSGTATVGGKPAKLDIKVSCAATPNKLGVLCQSRIAIEGMGTIENTDLFGYDPGSKSYHWYCVAGFGEAHDHVGKLAGKGFSWSHQGPGKDGKLGKEAITMGLDDSGTKMEFRNDVTIGGQAAFKLVASMTKK